MSETNAALIRRFYEAFDAHDGATMATCYAPDARFSDPVFPDLRGERIGAMWTMLTGRSTDLRVELPEHEADGDIGSAHWIAHYTFSTGRKVVNDIQATFRFRDGLIVEHDDKFDFHRWARQALGPPGLLLGWTPIMKGAVRERAGGDLEKFLAEDASEPAPAPGADS